MSNLLKRVEVVSSNRSEKIPTSDREWEIARRVCLEVIEELGAVPYNQKGEVALACFATRIRDACLEEGAVPDKWADGGRLNAAYRAQAASVVKELVAEAQKAAVKALKASQASA